MKKRLLVTGFEPFNGQIINPSLEAIRMLGSMQFANSCIETLELPVHRFNAIESTLNRILDFQPHIVLMLGEAGGGGDITPERQAFNLDDFPIPDHGGHQPKQELIVEGGPENYFSTLPIQQIEKQLLSSKIPVSISESAGRYLCNRLFYSVMHALTQKSESTQAGFVHLPYLREQVPELETEILSFTREEMREAIQLVVRVCLGNH